MAIMQEKQQNFLFKIEWILRAYCEISAHTDVPNIFFSILNCLFAMNWNYVILYVRVKEWESSAKHIFDNFF